MEKAGKTPSIVRYGLPLATGVILLAACSESGKPRAESPELPVAPSASAVLPPAGAGGVELPSLQFAGHGNELLAYPGTSNSAEDLTPNGQFSPGETVPVECRTTGREVDGSATNTDPRTAIWYRVMGTPGLTQYVIGAHVEMTSPKGEPIPSC